MYALLDSFSIFPFSSFYFFFLSNIFTYYEMFFKNKKNIKFFRFSKMWDLHEGDSICKCQFQKNKRKHHLGKRI